MVQSTINKAKAFFMISMSLVTLINAQIHGLAYNAKHSDGECPEIIKLQTDLKFLTQYTKNIRTFGLRDCNQGELTLQAAQTIGINVALAIFVNNNETEFEMEFALLKTLVKKYTRTFQTRVNSIIVGSEAIYRKDQTIPQLVEKILIVKDFIQTQHKLNINITTADTYGNWYPSPLVNAVDYMMVNMYPFWESVPIDHAIKVLFEKIDMVKDRVPNKQFVLGETGWPQGGKHFHRSIASHNNQITYFNQFICRANKEMLEYFYFSAFDEEWKEDEINANWGIFRSYNVKNGMTVLQKYSKVKAL